MFWRPVYTALALVLLAARLVCADVHYVAPAGADVPPYTNWATAAQSIQEAVNAAAPGDTVLLSNGLYTLGSQVIIGNPITVTTLQGREHTLIDANAHRAFYVAGVPAVIDGVTVTNGDSYTESINRGGAFWLDGQGTVINSAFVRCRGYLGGAAYISGDCLISNCVFTGNTGSISGGGAVYTYHLDSSAVIVDCELSHNLCYGWGGGAIIAYQSTVVARCHIHHNTAMGGNGGGVWLGDNAVLADSVLYGNAASNYGGAVYTFYEGPRVSRCVISNNYAIFLGGGVGYNYDGLVEDSIVCYNAADAGGGVGMISNGSFDGGEVNRCFVYSNSANYGGGVFTDWRGRARNCVIADNHATTRGGGVEFWYSGGLESSTVCGNTCDGPGDGVDLLYGSGGYTGPAGYVSNSIIYYNGDENTWTDKGKFNFCCSVPLPDGSSSITNAPRFINHGMHDFRLHVDSACINAGANMAWMTGATDFGGTARILDGTVDMGAYETPLALWCDFAANHLKTTLDTPVIFTADVRGSNTAWVSYDWSFGPRGTGLNQVAATYTTTGLFDVSLTVSNGTGEVYTRLKRDYIEVVPEPLCALVLGLAYAAMVLRHQRGTA
jgi:hypothetical protein